MTAEEILSLVEAYGMACGVCEPGDGDEAKDLHAQIDAAVTALANERDRLQTLVGDEQQEGWEGCSRAEAIRQADESNARLLEYMDLHRVAQARVIELREHLEGYCGQVQRLAGEIVALDGLAGAGTEAGAGPCPCCGATRPLDNEWGVCGPCAIAEGFVKEETT